MSEAQHTNAFAGVVLAIDPGPQRSGWLLYDCAPTNAGAVPRWPILRFGIDDNDVLLAQIRRSENERIAIEMIASYGMPVGAEVFETCIWIGRFIERAADFLKIAAGVTDERGVSLYTRQQIKLHHCASPRANDGNIRQALIDRYGGRIRAIGTAKNPGPLHGVHNDVWSALAIAQKFADDHQGVPF